MDTLLTPDETAERLRLSRRTVVAWLQEGRLPGIKVGNRWRIKVQDVEALLDESASWLDADMGGELPPYDWGPEGIPALKPVRYQAGKGLVIDTQGCD